MKRNLVILTTLLILGVLAGTPAQAADPLAGLQLSVVTYVPNSYMDVLVSVNATSTMGSPSTFGMATSNQTINYDPSVLTSWSVQNYGNFSGGQYSTLNVVTPTYGLISIGIVLNGTPTTVGSSWKDICTIRFNISPTYSGSTNIYFQHANSYTNVYKYATPFRVQLTISPYNELYNTPAPVQLTTFTGMFIDQSIRLHWLTATEINSYRFNVERSINGADFNTIGFVPAHGESATPNTYSYLDADIENSLQYWYRLKMIDRDGSAMYSSTIRIITGSLASKAELYATYPNPCNTQATVHFKLPSQQAATLTLFDASGREVLRLIDNEILPAGYNTRALNAMQLPGGEYILRMTAASYQSSEKIMIQK